MRIEHHGISMDGISKKSRRRMVNVLERLLAKDPLNIAVENLGNKLGMYWDSPFTVTRAYLDNYRREQGLLW